MVDDAFDLEPRAADIPTPGDVWSVFRDDLTEEQHRHIVERYAQWGTEGLEESYSNDSFVRVVWEIRDQLGPNATAVFADYVRSREGDQRYLQVIQQQLRGLGYQCVQAGRDFVHLASDIEIILIDLFLGQGQNQEGFRASSEGLRQVIRARASNPPIVILMSRSHRLESRRNEFRDETGLLDSGFRIVKKEEIENSGILGIQLERLRQTADNTRRLARFVHVAGEGLEKAAERTLKLFRRLKLSDITQIQELLLEAEGEPVGSYLVDILDRVLLHELEREHAIIEAAQDLNHFSTETSPAPYVAGSPDLQQLVARVLTQNSRRLDLRSSTSSPVAFGDLIRVANREGDSPSIVADLGDGHILLVVTPACDLQRSTAPRILLLVGKHETVSPREWTSAGDKTMAIILGAEMSYIEWDKKHIVSITKDELGTCLAHGRFELVGRLRESHALAIQQKVLSDLGRIGQIASLPGTFAIPMKVFYLDENNQPQEITVPELGGDEAVVWVGGRDAKTNPLQRLITTEVACDGILRAIGEIDVARVSGRARRAFDLIKSTEALRTLLLKGIPLRGVSASDWYEFLVHEEHGQNQKIGLLSFGPRLPELKQNQQSKAGILVHVVGPERSTVSGECAAETQEEPQ